MIRVTALASASPQGACGGAGTFAASAQVGEAGGPGKRADRMGLGAMTQPAHDGLSILSTVAARRRFEPAPPLNDPRRHKAANDPVAAQEGNITSG